MRRRGFVLVLAAMVGVVSTAPSALSEGALRRRADHPAGGRTGIVMFHTTPFPYVGNLPDEDHPFLDARDGDRVGHTSPRGGVHWQDATYASKDVLISVPPGFDARKPIALVVFFHGNNAKLERDVWHRQRVAEQLAQSHLNAILIAPQFALDALDSSAGNFWSPGIFAEFLAEAATRVAIFAGDPYLADRLAAAPVLLVAYSGGYDPAAYALTIGGARDRICGVILLDALFGESARFTWWLAHRGEAFFVSAYSKSSEPQNLALENGLRGRGVAVNPALDGHAPIVPAGIAFVPATQATHNEFVTAAWTASPLRSLLSRVKACQAGSPPAASVVRSPSTGSFEFSPPPGPGFQPGGPLGIIERTFGGGHTP